MTFHDQPTINVDAELERMLFPVTVPDDLPAARRYAARLQTRHLSDLRKMADAATQLDALAEGAGYLGNEPLQRALHSIADSLS